MISTPTPESDQPGISIVVCCYNSASRLESTLRALAQLEPVAGCQLEVLVIDNSSTDDTYAVAQGLGRQLAMPWAYRVLRELRSGKSHAIELGFEQAAYRYVAIVDDDNWLAPDYMRIAWPVLEANPAIGVLGGQGEPVGEVPFPEWFATYAHDYATGPQGDASGDITDAKGYLYGAGQIIRKAAWQHVLAAGFQSVLTGRKGAKLNSGEDNEMCYAIVLAGYRIWYNERLRFQHFIPARRLQWQHVLNLYAGNATSEAELSPYLYFLRNSQAATRPVRPLVSLRHAVSMVQYCGRYAWRVLRERSLLAATNPNRLRLRYYWQSIGKYLAKEWQGNPGYQQVRSFIQRLAAQPLS